MLTVLEIIKKVRGTVHDEQETGYTDDVLLGYINDGTRILRRIVMDIEPLLLAEECSAHVMAGENTLELTETVEDINAGTVTENNIKVSRICDVRANGKSLKLVRVSDINDLERQGTPSCYYLQGFFTIKLWPVPDADMSCSVLYVRDMPLLAITDTSPFPMEIDDFLVEYTILRASLGNEFEMSQEHQIIGMITGQVEAFLYAHTKPRVSVRGYWTDAGRGNDYGR